MLKRRYFLRRKGDIEKCEYLLERGQMIQIAHQYTNNNFFGNLVYKVDQIGDKIVVVCTSHGSVLQRLSIEELVIMYIEIVNDDCHIDYFSQNGQQPTSELPGWLEILLKFPDYPFIRHDHNCENTCGLSITAEEKQVGSVDLGYQAINTIKPMVENHSGNMPPKVEILLRNHGRLIIAQSIDEVLLTK